VALAVFIPSAIYLNRPLCMCDLATWWCCFLTVSVLCAVHLEY